MRSMFLVFLLTCCLTAFGGDGESPEEPFLSGMERLGALTAQSKWDTAGALDFEAWDADFQACIGQLR